MATSDFNIDFLLKRQDQLEKELNNLKKMYSEMNEAHVKDIKWMNKRINKLEKEIAEIRETLNELKASNNLIQKDVSFVKKHVSEINTKQDFAIEVHEKFISQLWKAFFALLGIVSVVAGGITYIVKL